MASQIERLATAVRHLSSGANPASNALEGAARSARSLAAAVPDGDGHAAVAALLHQAETAARRAERQLGQFAPGARAFADRLATAGGGGGEAPKGDIHWGPLLKTSAMVAGAVATELVKGFATIDPLSNGLSEALGGQSETVLNTLNVAFGAVESGVIDYTKAAVTVFKSRLH